MSSIFVLAILFAHWSRGKRRTHKHTHRSPKNTPTQTYKHQTFIAEMGWTKKSCLQLPVIFTFVHSFCLCARSLVSAIIRNKLKSQENVLFAAHFFGLLSSLLLLLLLTMIQDCWCCPATKANTFFPEKTPQSALERPVVKRTNHKSTDLTA